MLALSGLKAVFYDGVPEIEDEGMMDDEGAVQGRAVAVQVAQTNGEPDTYEVIANVAYSIFAHALIMVTSNSSGVDGLDV